MTAVLSNILKETRLEILKRLKARGKMSVDLLATEIGVSRVSIRRHLDLLRLDGFVDFRVEKRERGRPGHVYFLTERAEILFPTRYHTFALGVLNQVRALFGESGLLRVIRGNAEEAASGLRQQLEGLDFDSRVRRLSELLNERGYDAELTLLEDGSYRMRQRNCPMYSVARIHTGVCDEELRLYLELIESSVVRDCRIAAGAQSCDYRILRPVSVGVELGAARKAAGGGERWGT